MYQAHSSVEIPPAYCSPIWLRFESPYGRTFLGRDIWIPLDSRLELSHAGALGKVTGSRAAGRAFSACHADCGGCVGCIGWLADHRNCAIRNHALGAGCSPQDEGEVLRRVGGNERHVGRC
ncbi:hypothetical protein L1887_57141 [Cichorium endivia]|nr:hypothetical protein L1887_57141 [Cichorium endivia]